MRKTSVVLLGALPLFCLVSWLLYRPMRSFAFRYGGGLLFSGAVVGADRVDLGWYPPAKSWISNLTAVIGDEGVHGFIFNSSETPADIYGTYNWCNMPHVRDTEYIKPDDKYHLIYVELIHRHHKRTPYQDNSFPVESYPWDCDDVHQFHHSTPVPITNNQTATPAYWKPSPHLPNPFTPSGWHGTCSFPQITAAGLLDSWNHGSDLYTTYHTLHRLLPSRSSSTFRSVAAYHVTNNPITSQVTSLLLHGTWRSPSPFPLLIQPPQTDPLEPRYPCPAASRLRSSLLSSPTWKAHLAASAPLFSHLDALSGVPPSDPAFHTSIDHYFDNLSARECHGKPLPCVFGPGKCITRELADAVYRLGQWEYNYLYRSAGPETLAFAVASFGVWIAQLAGNLRAVVEGRGGEVVYRHHVAHDGSVSRLLAVLQVDEMVWPGMGAEVVFELYRLGKGENGEYFVRVLFGGRVLASSNPSLGRMEMVRVEVVLGYFEGLVGVGGELVVEKCK